MTVKREAKYVLAAAVAAMLPLVLFINKAYFLDSYIYLVPAGLITKKPLNIYDIDLGGYGKLFFWHTHPPLTSYIIAPVALFGDLMKEWQVNIIFILLAGLASVSAYLLASKYSKKPLVATLLFAGMPAFLLSFSQVNADPVTLTFWMLSAALLFRAVEKESALFFSYAGGSAGLAMLASYQALVILPLAVFYLYFKRYRNLNALIFFGVSLSLFGLWCLQNYVYYGQVQLFLAPGAGNASVSADLMGRKALSCLSLIGGAGLFPLLYLYVIGKERGGVLLIAAGFISAAVFVFFGGYKDIPLYTLPQKLMLVIFAATGGVVLLWMMKELVKALRGNLREGAEGEQTYFLLWFWIVILYNILVMPFESARYLLPAYAPLALVFARRVQEAPEGLRVRKGRVLAAGIALNLILCVGLLYADYQQAGVYRDYAKKVEKGRLMGGKAYFDADWGFWFYLERRGAQRIQTSGRPIENGDMYIRPVYTSPEPLSEVLRVHLLPVREDEINTWFPLRTLSKAAEAGYYSQVWGFLPYSFTDAPLDTISAYKYVSETQSQTQRSDNLGELYGRRVVTQRFISKLPNIEGMGFEAGMYGRKCSGHLHFRLTGPDGDVLAEKRIPLSGLEDGWIYVDFPPVKGALGKAYEVSFTSPDSVKGDAATLFYNDKPLDGVSLSRDGKRMDGSLAFIIFN